MEGVNWGRARGNVPLRKHLTPSPSRFGLVPSKAEGKGIKGPALSVVEWVRSNRKFTAKIEAKNDPPLLVEGCV